MTLLDAYKALRLLIVRLDSDAKAIDPAHVTLTDVVMGHQGAERPDGAYATITYQGVKDTNELHCSDYADITIGADSRTKETRYRINEVMFTVEIFAKDALDRAAFLMSAVRNPAATVDFPLVVRSVTQPKFAPELVQQIWEGQAMFTVIVAGAFGSSMLIDVIEHVPISLNGDTAAVPTFTVDKP